MTTPRTPRPDPVAPPTRSRPSEERAELAAAIRSARTVALLALLVSAVALGLAVFRLVLPGQAGCQTAAWDAQPATRDLPSGWTVSATQYDISRKTMSLLGALPLDGTTSQPVVYVTVTCYEQGAADTVTRSATAAADAGQTVTERKDLGDQAFSSTDDSGAAFLQLRHGNVVVYLAASGDATPTEVDELASAFDKALGGDGGAISADSGAPVPPDASVDPSLPDASDVAASPAAPALEAKLPTQVGTVALTVDSAVGADILGQDQGSRAILAALRAEGKEANALTVAQAYDATGASDLTLLAVAVDGMSIDKVTELVLDSWLAASGAGVTRTQITLGGQAWTQVDYGDEGARDYVRAQGGVVFVVTSSDPAVAAQAAAALP
ncbi:MAG: hypothetical protein WCK58_05655 [Chloroflexota bacterium]